MIYRKDATLMSNRINQSAMFRLQYGLYCLTARDGAKDNGCIINTAIQVTSDPQMVAVTVSKQNYTCDIIKKTGEMNINCLSKDTPFEVFKRYGFQSGRAADKFTDISFERSANGLAILPEYANAYISVSVKQEVDLGSHILFIGCVTEAEVLSDSETITYGHYQSRIKPKPEKKGFVCKICGYVYSGDVLPEDYICPICKHGAVDFEPM